MESIDRCNQRTKQHISMLLFFCVLYYFVPTNVCGLPRHKLSKCFTSYRINYTLDIRCMDGSLIHVIKEKYLNSSSSDTCTSDYNKCSGLIVKNNKISTTDPRLQTACNGKTKCNEILEPAYFICSGKRLATVDYECVPESVNYNMCNNLRASSTTNESVFYLESPKSGTSDPILCHCEIRGKNMRVQIADFRANMTDKEKWFLNITSGFMLNDSTPSNSLSIRLLNNILGGFHDIVHIMYYSEDPSNQNIWIELTGFRNVQMNLTCSSTTYFAKEKTTRKPQTSTQTSTHTTSKTQKLTNNSYTYNTNYTSAFTDAKEWTPTVIPPSHPVSSVSATVERSKSTEVTTSVSAEYSSEYDISQYVAVIENYKISTIALAVVTGILFTLLITLSGLFCWHLKRHRTKSESADHEMVNTDTRRTVQERNISDAVYEISDPNQTNNIPRLGDIYPQRNYVNSSASPRRTPDQQSPRGSTRNGSYVNSGRDGQDHDLDSSSNRDYVNSQDNQPNEYEHLDPSMTSQNVYEKLNENTNI